MPRKALPVIAAIALAASAMILYALSPASLDEIFRQPFNVLLGFPGRVNVTLLEVSSNSAPSPAANRPLFKPFGMVQFIRSIPWVSSLADQQPSGKNPAKK
jgi:hypothetical protein